MAESSALLAKPWFWVPSASVASGCLCAVSALFPQYYLLGWIAFVPFLLGLQQCRSAWQSYGFGLLTGFFIFGFSTYWMVEFIQIFKAYSIIRSVGLASLYWFYCAQMVGIIAVLTHCGRRGNAVLWVFPTVFTLAFAYYPTLFPWQLGNAQNQFLVALQATDITGVSGLDFVIGIVNVLVAQALIGRPAFFQRSVLAAYALVAVWFTYGVFSLAYWQSATDRWAALKVGVVQPDEPPVIGTPDPRPGFSLSYPVEMDLTEQLVAAGAELVIWPEYNRQYYNQAFVRAAYQRQVEDMERPLLFQSVEEQGQGERALKFNTVTLLDGSGNQIGKYRKIKRIALAEYLPLFGSSETVKGWVRHYLGEFFGNYSAGPGPKKFDIGTVSITPFICYEINFPSFVAASLAATGADILTVQSNNGWFGDTRVPYLHVGSSVLRSVENRRPLVHVMNNGLGVVSLPSGRILLHTAPREIAGYLLDVPYRKSAFITFYTRFPYWLAALLGLGLVLMLVRTWRSAGAT